jgi:serine/threonine protein kinase
MLPLALEGVLEAAIALRGALDPEAHGPPAGTIIGDFAVVKTLGTGGMGSCVLAKARSVRTAPHVVLKLPRRTTGIHRTLFRNEALALLQLVEAPHPGIVRFVAFNDGSGVPPHLVMEYVEGISLEKRLTAGPLPIGEALSVFARLARAIAHAHGYRMGHYDIKPANVMLAKKLSDAPVLVDWGIAGATFRASVGTPAYMAPERYVQEVDSATAVASDVYALGCLLVEMASGVTLLGPPITAFDDHAKSGVKAAFDRMEGMLSRVLVAQLIATDEPIRKGRVARALKDAPPWTVELVLEMLADKPAARPTAATVVQRLESFGM